MLNDTGNNFFSKKDTVVVKGLAVLLLCLHHLYWRSVTLPVTICRASAGDLLTSWTKVCVALFVIISGYGLTKSFAKSGNSGKEFVFLHIKKLLIGYWWVYIPVFFLSYFFHFMGRPVDIYGGNGLYGTLKLLMDALGVRAFFYTPTLNQTWWYMEAIFVLYLLFPILYKLMKKFPWLPMVLGLIPVLLVAFNIYWNPVSQTEREIYWFFPFAVGMFLAEKDLLNRAKEKLIQKPFLSLVVIGSGIFLCLYWRAKMLLLPDTFYGLILILLCIWINCFAPKIINLVLACLGKYSFQIFLIHSFLYYYFPVTANLIGKLPDAFGIRYISFVAISLGCVVVLNHIKSWMEYQSKSIKWTLGTGAFIAFLFAWYYDNFINMINATMMAFSYRYGFISRAFVGTFYQFCNQILPVNMMTNPAAIKFTFIITVMVCLFLWLFGIYLWKNTGIENRSKFTYIYLIFLMATVPMFVSEYNFGRLDLYMMGYSLLAVWLLMAEKAEWLVVPLCAFGVLTHQGYVFMFFHVVLVFLLYYAYRRKNKTKYYIFLFIISIIIVAALFFWIELFSHGNGVEIYDSIVGDATLVCPDGNIHEDVIRAEILGMNLADSEIEIMWRLPARLQFVVYIVLMIPFWLPLVKGFKNVISQITDKVEKALYLLLSVGALTILPDLLFKVDFGRWMYTVIFYYSVVLSVLIKENDNKVLDVINGNNAKRAKMIKWYLPALLIYFLFMQPFGDVDINTLTKEVVYTFNGAVLHLW